MLNHRVVQNRNQQARIHKREDETRVSVIEGPCRSDLGPTTFAVLRRIRRLNTGPRVPLTR